MYLYQSIIDYMYIYIYMYIYDIHTYIIYYILKLYISIYNLHTQYTTHTLSTRNPARKTPIFCAPSFAQTTLKKLKISFGWQVLVLENLENVAWIILDHLGSMGFLVDFLVVSMGLVSYKFNYIRFIWYIMG